MPQKRPPIHVDPSCHSTPMDEEISSPTSNVEKNSEAPQQTRHAYVSSDDEEVPESSDRNMTEGAERDTKLQPSIESDDDVGETSPDSRGLPRRFSKRTEELIERAARDAVYQMEHDKSTNDEEAEEHSMLSERTDLSFEPDDGRQSYVNHSELDAKGASHISDTTPRVGDGDESSSQQGGTDEDVFTDKSPRSSMGSYDAGSESGKAVDVDNMTTITRSPRISDISQYDKEDFIPTARGTPRPPFRTPSDVRAMQMSSPTGSVLGSPRSSKKHFPTVSRLGTPSGSAQYSPKRKSTPPRFKSRHEAPLVLLHVTLLPLRWVWGELVNNLDPVEMSEQAKTLRNSWRILQDRVGDTVIERGILLGHPQNDYEVLEERLLEALDLPVRRRARILECGHYLGPSNEATIVEEDEEEGEDDDNENRPRSPSKRHWCATCKSEIRYDSLGGDKVFRVKVYASNGLMRAGAWEACWKEMERVDVELEPIVEPVVQDEIVRLAAAQQEREIAQQEEAEIAKEVALQYEEQRRNEEHQRAKAEFKSPSSPEPEEAPEATREPTRESRSSRRRQRDEERLREIYGHTPPPPESHAREPSPQRRDSFVPPPSPRPPPEEANERRGDHRRGYQSATLPELLLQSARVLMQDRKNVVIVTLSLFVLILSLRSTPPEATYEPIVHRMKTMPEMQRMSDVNSPPAVRDQQHPIEAHIMESIVATPSFEVAHSEHSESSPIYYEASNSEPFDLDSPTHDSQETFSIEQPSMVDVVSETVSELAQETSTTATAVSRIYEPCESPADSSSSADIQASSAVSDIPVVQDDLQKPTQETVEEVETITEKKVVKVYQTVTETQFHTQTQTETQTEAETATTTTETAEVEATEIPEPAISSIPACTPSNSQDDAVLVETTAPVNEVAEDDSVLEPVPDPVPESEPESVPESVPECIPELAVEPAIEAVVEPEDNPVEV
ncbi:hypothetical protein GGR58DRAFT_517321 [Xylaria digitata]|nr:hypothetical protein GGR58DRAFT_517321 [Xylaria digitata]